jgi:hypothetical protein
MPNLDFAFLADSAEANPHSRKFYVLGGGFDSIGAPAFPAIHPHVSIVARILVHPAEADRSHTLEIKMMDADGGALANIEGQFAASAAPQPGREIAVPLVINIANVQFQQPGDYSIEILINNQHMKSLPLHVALVAQPDD